MAFYENTIVAKQDLAEKDLKIIKEKYNDLINSSSGKVIKIEEWGLIKIISDNTSTPLAPMSQIKVLPYKEKTEWELIPKYNIGVVSK